MGFRANGEGHGSWRISPTLGFHSLLSPPEPQSLTVDAGNLAPLCIPSTLQIKVHCGSEAVQNFVNLQHDELQSGVEGGGLLRIVASQKDGSRSSGFRFEDLKLRRLRA